MTLSQEFLDCNQALLFPDSVILRFMKKIELISTVAGHLVEEGIFPREYTMFGGLEVIDETVTAATSCHRTGVKVVLEFAMDDLPDESDRRHIDVARCEIRNYFACVEETLYSEAQRNAARANRDGKLAKLAELEGKLGLEDAGTV